MACTASLVGLKLDEFLPITAAQGGSSTQTGERFMLQGLSEGFALGIWTLIGAAAGPVVVAVGFGVRKVAAYFNGVPTPDRPFKAWLAMGAVLCAIVGSMWQAQADRFAECRAAGGTTPQCITLAQSSRE